MTTPTNNTNVLTMLDALNRRIDSLPTKALNGIGEELADIRSDLWALVSAAQVVGVEAATCSDPDAHTLMGAPRLAPPVLAGADNITDTDGTNDSTTVTLTITLDGIDAGDRDEMDAALAAITARIGNRPLVYGVTVSNATLDHYTLPKPKPYALREVEVAKTFTMTYKATVTVAIDEDDDAEEIARECVDSWDRSDWESNATDEDEDYERVAASDMGEGTDLDDILNEDNLDDARLDATRNEYRNR